MHHCITPCAFRGSRRMHIVQRSVIRPLEGGGRNQRLGLLTASCTARKPLFSATPSACAAVMASCSRSRLFNAVCYTRRHTQWARFGRSALQTLNCCSQRTSCAPRGGCSRRISKGPMGPFGSNTVCRSAGPTELLRTPKTLRHHQRACTVFTVVLPKIPQAQANFAAAGEAASSQARQDSLAPIHRIQAGGAPPRRRRPPGGAGRQPAASQPPQRAAATTQQPQAPAVPSRSGQAQPPSSCGCGPLTQEASCRP
jgi:hypothetical protein